MKQIGIIYYDENTEHTSIDLSGYWNFLKRKEKMTVIEELYMGLEKISRGLINGKK